MTNNTTAHQDALRLVHEEAGRTLSKSDFDLCMRIAKRALLTSPRSAVPQDRRRAFEAAMTNLATLEGSDPSFMRNGDDTYVQREMQSAWCGFESACNLLDAAPAAPVAEPASQGVIAAALAVIECDRAQALTDAHIDALDSAIKIQRGEVELPPAAQAVAADGATQDGLLKILSDVMREFERGCLSSETEKAARNALKDGRAAVSPATADERAHNACCPFCGSDDFYTDSALDKRQALCNSCEAAGPTEETDEEAIASFTRMRASQAAAPADAREASLTPAARDVLSERARQVSVEGWTPARDDQYTNGELAQAASLYAVSELKRGDPPLMWPWAADWWKPTDERRNRVKAAALLLAEIERIDRAAAAQGAQGAQGGKGGEA